VTTPAPPVLRPARVRPVLAAALAALLCACGEDAPRQTPGEAAPRAAAPRHVKIQHNWLSDVALAGIFLAMENGYYRDAGLEVEVVPGGPGSDPVVAVTSGAALVGIHTNATSVLLARAQGIPLRVIAAQYRRSPLGLVGKASSGIRGIEDVRGRRIGVIQSSVSVLDAVLQANGLGRDDVQVVVVSPAASMDLLMQDRIDLFVGFATNQPVQMKLRGVPAVFLPFHDLGYRQEAYPFFVTEQTLAREPELLRALLDATRRGWEDALRNPENAARVTTSKYTRSTEVEKETEVARLQASLMRPPPDDGTPLFYMDRGTWEATNQVLVRSGLIREPVDLDRLLTWELLDARTARRG
jgi:NitT/TauT family transport system substrate-binding protein